MACFVIWSKTYQEGFCVVKPPSGIKKAYQLDTGVSRAEGWPSDVACQMSPDYPKDIELSDNLFGARLAVVSGRIQAALVGENVNHVEFLPLTILNHKGRVAATDYSIMNPLDICDCIDMEQSEVTRNPVDGESIMSCKRLVFRDDSIPPKWKVFRPKFATARILIRADIVKTLEAIGCSGIVGMDPLQYTGYA